MIITILKIWCRKTVPKISFIGAILYSSLFHQESMGQALQEIKVYDKTFQFSMFPGVSTNGIDTWNYHNKYSFNLFGGLSAGNKYLEIGSITNINLYGSSGIQIAGLANIVGANAFTNLTKSERRTAIAEGFEANTQSFQIAGLLNFNRNNATAIQISGGMNLVGNDFEGFQFSLLGNGVGGHTLGTQIGGLYNVSSKSIVGLQFSVLFNKVHQNLSGLQIGMINSAQVVTGKKSASPSNLNSVQIGLINTSKKMTGLQIGLINFGGSTVGTQIGIINFFSTQAPKHQTSNGTPIGLLNFGSSGPLLRLHSNELFLASLEITTGNCSNCTYTASGMPFNDQNKKYNQNALIVGINKPEGIWGFGYGFQKLLLNKFDMTGNPKNGKRMISYGIQFLHLSSSEGFEKQFNLLTKIHAEWGKRLLGLHVFGGFSINYFIEELNEQEKSYVPKYLHQWTSGLFNRESTLWIGYTVGVQI